MRSFKAILWDIDNTLLDFFAAEREALGACFKSFSLGELSEERLRSYSEINHRYWQRLEKGELKKSEVLLGRFREFFSLSGIPENIAADFNEEYQKRLGDCCVFMDNGRELVARLKEKGFKQYAATNGTYTAQERKLRNSGLDKLLDGAFISDLIGHEKPTEGFFGYVSESLREFDRDELIIVGDSLSSDIKGGVEHGIYAVWYNPRHIENTSGIKPDREISNLWDIEAILCRGL